MESIRGGTGKQVTVVDVKTEKSQLSTVSLYKYVSRCSVITQQFQFLGKGNSMTDSAKPKNAQNRFLRNMASDGKW